MTEPELDLDQIRDKWMTPCRHCELDHEEEPCTCPDRARSTIGLLVDEVEQLRSQTEKATDVGAMLQGLRVCATSISDPMARRLALRVIHSLGILAERQDEEREETDA